MATRKQKKFITEYLKSRNATDAARKAGYKSPNVYGSKLLVNDSIREIIDAALEEEKLSAHEVLKQLSEMADGVDLTRYIVRREKYTADGKLRGVLLDFDFEKLQADEKSHLIKGIKQDSNGQIVVEFYDRAKPLVDLARYHGLFKDRVDITSDGKPLSEGIGAAIDKIYGKDGDE